LGLDPVEDADFIWRAPGIAILADIFLSLLVNVLVGALFGDLGYATANREMPVRVIGVEEVNPNSRIAAHVAVLDVALDGVDDNVLAIVIDPNGSDVRASVWH